MALRFWEGSKERQISLGVYPEVSLNEARVKRDELQNRRKNGELISTRLDKMSVTFQEAAGEWLTVRMKDKAAGYLKSIHLRLAKYILPAIGNLKLSEIKSPVILKLCREIENKEFYETAHRIRALIRSDFSFRDCFGILRKRSNSGSHGGVNADTTKHMAALVEPAK